LRSKTNSNIFQL